MVRYSVVLVLVLVGVFCLGCSKSEPTPPAGAQGATQKMPDGTELHQ